MHYIIPKSTDSLRDVNKLCKNFDVHNVNKLIALPKDANVPLKTGGGFGKTTHFGYHSGYNEAAIGAMKVAARFKPNVGRCKKLAVVQGTLKKQLQAGGQTMYGNAYPNGTGGVEKDRMNTVRNQMRGK